MSKSKVPVSLSQTLQSRGCPKPEADRIEATLAEVNKLSAGTRGVVDAIIGKRNEIKVATAAFVNGRDLRRYFFTPYKSATVAGKKARDLDFESED